VQAGYALAASDSDELRFMLADADQPYLPGDPLFSTAGEYNPYYTPRRQVSHSVIAALRLSGSTGAALRVSGSYGFHATEDAPFFFVSAGALHRAEAQRDLTPWRGRVGVDVPVSSRLTLRLGGELGRTSFYRWSTGDLEIVYRFSRRPHPGSRP
jgi:hypothetical protein